MPYSDAWATCTRCNSQFIFTIEEQRRSGQQDAADSVPQLCPKCRAPEGSSAQPRPERQTQSGADRRSQPRPERRTQEDVGEGPHEGTVKWYDAEKGYGFITHPGGSEFFFHRNSVNAVSAGLVQDGARVTYRVEKSPKGPQAVDVTLVE